MHTYTQDSLVAGNASQQADLDFFVDPSLPSDRCQEIEDESDSVQDGGGSVSALVELAKEHTAGNDCHQRSDPLPCQGKTSAVAGRGGGEVAFMHRQASL